ncbi:TPA: hypothetical protein ACYEUF_002396 [Klebsiella pneumoniae]
MNHTLSDSQLEEMIKSAVNSSGPLPPDEKFSQLVSALRELQERRKADSEPVAYMYRQVQELRNRFGTCDEWEINCRLVESDFPAVEIPESEDYEFLPLYLHAQPAPVAPVCTCPSGDGSLRWPCPVHAGSSPVIPDGYVLVPKEPTAEMQSAGASAIRIETTALNKLWTGNAVFRAMLAAAPQEVKSES